MSFQMPAYQAPDFTEERFVNAPNVAMAPAPKDGVALITRTWGSPPLDASAAR